MPLSDFSVEVGKALVSALPQLEEFVHAGPGQFHLEIRYPHPRAELELLITTENDEITVFLGCTHRHIGMCEQWPVERQIQEAIRFVGDILSGSIPLARSSRYPGLWIDEDRSHAEHPTPGEIVTFTTWNDLAA